jgi:hypothetical protein
VKSSWDTPRLDAPIDQPLTAFLSSLLAENFAARDAEIWIVSPVLGLRPCRAARADREFAKAANLDLVAACR